MATVVYQTYPTDPRCNAQAVAIAPENFSTFFKLNPAACTACINPVPNPQSSSSSSSSEEEGGG